MYPREFVKHSLGDLRLNMAFNVPVIRDNDELSLFHDEALLIVILVSAIFDLQASFRNL